MPTGNPKGTQSRNQTADAVRQQPTEVRSDAHEQGRSGSAAKSSSRGKSDTPRSGQQSNQSKSQSSPGPASMAKPGANIGSGEQASGVKTRTENRQPASQQSGGSSAAQPGRREGYPTGNQRSASGGGGGHGRSSPGSQNSKTGPARSKVASPRGNGRGQQGRSQHPVRTPGASGRRGGSSTRSQPRSEAAPPSKPKEAPVLVTEIVIPEQLTVRELADKMHRSPIEVIKTLMNYGMMVPITESIDFGTAAVVGEELGIMVKPEARPEPEPVAVVKEEPRTLRQRILADENPEALVLRPPIVTVLGHVDHGKTTLLDAIRETRVVEGEAGGITQHIGAYQVEAQGRKITFLDTPGHEAFTAMRARGAMVTDIAVLVVAADDGVMPQTKEAIAHARAAQVPIVVALNKIDKPTANPDRVKQELADNGLLIEEYGGDVMCVPVSAKLRRGISDLLDSILLVADIDPLMANPAGHCVGTVIEARLDKARGPMATLLIQNGTLRVGDGIVTGETSGKIRAMYDDKGQPISAALPATPAVVLGLADVPVAGDTFSVEVDERTARGIAAERQERKRAEAVTAAPKATSLETIFAQAETGQTKELNLILKADVQGSIEPIVNSLEKLGDEKLHVKLLHQATGNITESDVMLAVASRAIILGFAVVVDPAAQRIAEVEGVDIRIYSIIYNLVEDVQKALTGLLEPVYREVVTGHAEVRAVFRITKVGKVAGCYVTDGELTRNSMVRIKRGDSVLREDRLTSLKRFQEDVSEVKTGFECGLNLGNFNDFEVGDIIEAYKKERVS
jgi:translation initiation factor IF-2